MYYRMLSYPGDQTLGVDEGMVRGPILRKGAPQNEFVLRHYAVLPIALISLERRGCKISVSKVFATYLAVGI